MSASDPSRRLVALAVLLGLIAACGPTGVDVAATGSPAPKKSTKPKPKPSATATGATSASTKPSASPTASPTASPAASPTASPSASPSASPTASAAASAGPTGDWSGTPTEAEALAHIGFPFEPVGRAWTYDAELKVSGFPIKGTMVQTVTAADATKATIGLAFDVAGKKLEQSQEKPRTESASSTPAVYTKVRITVPAGTFDTILAEETIQGQPAKTWYDKEKGPVQAIFETPDFGAVTVKLKSFKPS